MKKTLLLEFNDVHVSTTEKASEYDHEIPQSQNTDHKPMTLFVRVYALHPCQGCFNYVGTFSWVEPVLGMSLLKCLAQGHNITRLLGI